LLLLISAAVPYPVRYVWNWRFTAKQPHTVLQLSAGHHGLARLVGWRLCRTGNVTHTANANTSSRSTVKKSIEQHATKEQAVEIRAVLSV
jgi:hypothetical protein